MDVLADSNAASVGEGFGDAVTSREEAAFADRSVAATGAADGEGDLVVLVPYP